MQIDGDGQHDPTDVPRVLAPLRASVADLVIGSRFVNATGYRMGIMRSIGRFVFHRVLAACADFFPSDFPDTDVLLLLSRYWFRIGPR